MNFQSCEQVGHVGHVADALPKRRGQRPHEGRRGDDLCFPRQRRLLVNIDDLEIVPAGQVTFTQPPQVGHRLLIGAAR